MNTQEHGNLSKPWQRKQVLNLSIDYIMALATIKKEFHNKRVAFGKSAAPLGNRTDIDDLAIMAHESQNKTLLVLFDKLPELSVLKKAKTESQLVRPVVVEEKSHKPNISDKPSRNRKPKTEDPK
jgi:hypothetical protein